MYTATDDTAAAPLHLDQAVAARTLPDGTIRTDVHEGYDVYGIPHGGYLLALAGSAALEASQAPDIFTITVHYLRKAAIGEPLDFTLARIGGSRRFATYAGQAVQGEHTVMAVTASVGDRSSITGPAWTDRPAWTPTDAELGPPAGDPALPFQPPAVAQRFALRLARTDTAFAEGRTTEHALLRARMDTGAVTQLTALLASDVTPPAVWNSTGALGWVPTVELTAHVRARPAPGPMTVEVSTHHVADGFFEEDALVRDATGTLVVQSRQLARINEPG